MTTMAKRAGARAHAPAHVIETEVRTVERSPQRFDGKTVKLEGFPRLATSHGAAIRFELVERLPSVTVNPITVSVDFDEVSTRTRTIAKGLPYSMQRISVTGVVSVKGGAASIRATELENRD